MRKEKEKENGIKKREERTPAMGSTVEKVVVEQCGVVPACMVHLRHTDTITELDLVQGCLRVVARTLHHLHGAMAILTGERRRKKDRKKES